MHKSFSFDYLEFDGISELQSDERMLVAEAVKATESSYAPYSNFNVGAAVAMSNGKVVRGSNQENGAFPSSLCAERTAAFAASAAYPDAVMIAIAIVACQDGELVDNMFYPCGACRQVLSEYEMKGGTPMKIIVCSRKKVQVFPSVKSLLPFSFEMK